MTQEQVNLPALHGDVREALNFNANDAEARLTAMENTINVKTLADLPTAVGGFIDLPAGHYEAINPVDFGTDKIRLTSTGGVYYFGGHQLAQWSYTGVTPFITNTGINNIIFMDKINISTPNATAIEITSSPQGSVVMIIPLMINCLKVANFNSMGFLTVEGIAMVDNTSGIECTDVNIVTLDRMQWSSGKDAGGIGFKISGTGSRLSCGGVECEAEATESIFFIDNAYPGLVSMTSGVFTDNGGIFFNALGKNQTIPGIDALNIGGVPNSKTKGMWTVQNNTQATSLTQNNWVDFNFAGSVQLTDSNERFTLMNSTTGEIRNDSLEDFEGSLFCTISGFGSGGASEYQFRAVVNGIPLTPISILSANEISGTMSATALLSDIPLVTNDLVRIQLRNISNDSDFTGKFVTTLVT